MKPKILAAVLLGASLLLSSSEKISHYESERNLTRRVEESPGLVINIDDTVRYVTYKSEREGILDLHEEAKKQGFEEVWHCYPDKEKWIEVGVKSTTNQVSPKIEETRLSFSENKNIVEYHVHKVPSDDEVMDAFDRTPETNLEILEKYGFDIHSALKESYEGQLALPSPGDIHWLIYDSIDFYEYNPDGSLLFKIVSSHGVTEYGLTPGGLDVFRQDLSLVPNYVKKKDNDFENAVLSTAGFVNPLLMEDDLLYVKFTPIKEFLKNQ